MKKLLSALFVLALCSSVAFATVPDPTKCTVVPADGFQGVVLAPDSPSPISYTVYTVTVRNSANNPIPNASVTFEFPVPPDAAIRFCTTASNSQPTDVNGVAVITLRGGGCATGTNPYACLVKANGVVIRSYSAAKSPDWDSAANGSVNLGDLTNFFGNFPPGVAGCHDYDNNGIMNISDTIVFASAYFPSHGCTLQ